MLSRRATKLTVVVAAATAFVVLVGTPASAAAPHATLIAQRYDDGLDSRVSADRLASALSAIGYDAAAHTSGRSAGDAWSDGLGDAVFAAFGHANAGIFQTDEGPTDPEDEILAAGDLTYLNGGNVWFWGNYLHYLDVDDMRLAIFAGCYTANVDPDLDSFGHVGEERGVDSIVGFSDLVFFPALCTNCEYSGNKFWSRFASYAQAGDTVAVSLSKARNDLVAAEGNAGGWENWRIDGAVPQPGNVTLTPAGGGTEYNSAPFGIDPFDLVGLTPSRQRDVAMPGATVTDVDTREGVSYRVDAEGQLMWLQAPISTAGPRLLTEAEAASRAREFATRYAGGFDLGSAVVTTNRPSHQDGDRLFGFHWRLQTSAGPGAARLDLEVDRRTGAVTYFSAAAADGDPSTAVIGRDAAVAMARTALPVGSVAAPVVAADADVWSVPRWTVTFDIDGSGRFPKYVRVEVDAAAGRVMRQTAT